MTSQQESSPAKVANGSPGGDLNEDSTRALLDGIAYEKKKQEWGNWVEQQFITCKNARANFERQWYLNLAFINGRHYVSPVDVPGQGFRLKSTPALPWRVKLVVNKVRTAVITECSKLNSSKPIPTVLPATEEDEDYSSARVAEQLLKNQFANAHFNATYRSWLWWGVACGVSYLKQYWAPGEPDDDLMEPAEPAVGQNGVPLTNPQNGEPILKPQKPIMGKIMIERVTPFHLYVPDLLSEGLEDQPYIIHAMTRTPEWVEKNFNFKPTPDVRAANTIMESAFLVTKNAELHLDAVLVKEIWIKPNGHKDFPNGGLLTVINSKVVQCREEWPWPFKEYPFYKYDGIPTGSFYSDSTVVDLIPLNKEYNRKKSQMIEIMNTLGRPRFTYAKGSVNIRQISGEPGQGIPYIPGFDKPDIIPAAEVPQSMAMELDRLNADFDDISGQHEITRGNTPAQVTSGTAIAFLQEQDDTKLNYKVNSIEAAVELLGKHYLKFVATYWKEPRLIKIVGKDNNFEAIRWKGSQLRGNSDVRVQAGSGLPTSKAALRAFITEYMQNGWIDPVAGLEVLEIGALGKIIDEILVDKRQAQRENLKLASLSPEMVAQWQEQNADLQRLKEESSDPAEQGQLQPILPVNSWDNHQLHVEFHNQYRKTQEFEQLDEAVKEQFELHVQMHQLALTMPQMGALGPVANDPSAPLVDPESGNLMPNPMQEALPGMGGPPVGTDPNDLSGVTQLMQMQRDEEKHGIDMKAKEVEMELKKKLAAQRLQQKREGGGGP